MTDRKCLICVAVEADLQAVAQIHIASWQDAYKGIIPDPLLAHRSVEGSLSGWRRTFAKYPANITMVTSQDGVIQGFCCAGPVVDAVENAPFEFEIYGLHVSPNSRQGMRRVAWWYGLRARGPGPPHPQYPPQDRGRLRWR